ncbi:hypothetical protein CCU68_10360 [Pseudomonas gingeri NCPPB 3146 = LMG 5327]|uniref:Uncharacterized protein n=2 Tax=Pseudomonas gingeri TaxID=117681 RepID=A0A7Y7XY54_9PSED|nr:hypothetical protein [Pseudomonas gingeri]NWC13252.1 hypothetical protein [Pseudomonas gingeri]PNQ92698.1 hypothetical protein CCU68_10360 [Pseudomonas gingeri NCPPB 3146 = LMG 5327]
MPVPGRYLIAIPVYNSVDLLDEALEIIAKISSDTVAQKVQLNIQYNPCPPFNSGDPSVAEPPVYTPGDASRCDISGMAGTIAQVLRRRGHAP